MEHLASVRGPSFSDDQSVILTYSTETARLWSFASDIDFPQGHAVIQIEVITGTSLDISGNVRILSLEEWELKKKAYVSIAERHLGTCQYKEYNIYRGQKAAWEGINQ